METLLVVSSVVLWLVVLFNLFLTFALVRRSNRATPAVPKGGLKAGTVAPAFSATALDGGIKTLADYHGRKTAFIFISTHCQPCRDLLVSLRQLESLIHQVGVELVLVSSDERAETGALMEEFELHFPVLLAPQDQNPFFKDYKVVGTPAYCFINSQGKVHASGFPMIQSGKWQALAEDWDEKQAMVLSERK